MAQYGLTGRSEHASRSLKMSTFFDVDLSGFDAGAYMAEETRKAATAAPSQRECEAPCPFKGRAAQLPDDHQHRGAALRHPLRR